MYCVFIRLVGSTPLCMSKMEPKVLCCPPEVIMNLQEGLELLSQVVIQAQIIVAFPPFCLLQVDSFGVSMTEMWNGDLAFPMFPAQGWGHLESLALTSLSPSFGREHCACAPLSRKLLA